MVKKLLFLVLICVVNFAFAQELNCTVIVNSDQINQTNKQIFKTLEKSLNDYVNQTKWTDRTLSSQERIDCSMMITITRYENSSFSGTIQVQSNRPVYNSTYQSPVFNYQDKRFSFNYVEFAPLYFNPNVFDSNLTSVITYYVYIILGIDADTFSKEGGTPYFKQAQSIVNLAQGSGYAGWQQTDGNRTRWELVDNLLSNTFKEYRLALYNYHRLGMDNLVDNPSMAKQTIASSMNLFEKLNNVRPNSFVLQAFFDAKSEEIANVFSDGPKMNVADLKETLGNIAPLYTDTWSRIKY
ncbi:type IX secretion system protein PorD [Joostella sp. CR20]|uniref:type IX secretion system protein PorD n=1 Tax=Joostella sp. CR20 TaxID=2804312 RepID=UPI00313E0230